jgi:hypothetical protein
MSAIGMHANMHILDAYFVPGGFIRVAPMPINGSARDSVRATSLYGTAFLAGRVLGECGIATPAADELERHRQDLEALRDPAALRKAVDDTAQTLAQRKQAYDTAVREEGALEKELNETERQLRESRVQAAGYDITRDGSAAERAEKRDELLGALNAARQSRDEARAEVIQVKQDLEHAEQGQFGLAGRDHPSSRTRYVCSIARGRNPP